MWREKNVKQLRRYIYSMFVIQDDILAALSTIGCLPKMYTKNITQISKLTYFNITIFLQWYVSIIIYELSTQCIVFKSVFPFLYFNPLFFKPHDQLSSLFADDSLHPNSYIVHHTWKGFTQNVLDFSLDVCFKLFKVTWLGICINAILQIDPEKEVWWCQVW